MTRDVRTPLAVRTPVILTDGGPWAEHDQACAVCHVHAAILDLNDGVFLPCDLCSQEWLPPRRRRVGTDE